MQEIPHEAVRTRDRSINQLREKFARTLRAAADGAGSTRRPGELLSTWPLQKRESHACLSRWHSLRIFRPTALRMTLQ